MGSPDSSLRPERSALPAAPHPENRGNSDASRFRTRWPSSPAWPTSACRGRGRGGGPGQNRVRPADERAPTRPRTSRRAPSTVARGGGHRRRRRRAAREVERDRRRRTSSTRPPRPIEGGESVEAMRGWAKTHGITLVGGSITERREGREKLSNTCLVFDPEGERRGGLPQDPPLRRRGRRRTSTASPRPRSPARSRSSPRSRAGRSGSRSATTSASRSSTGSSALEGALLVTVPAHFTLYTGKDHWHLLLRAPGDRERASTSPRRRRSGRRHRPAELRAAR